MGEGDFRRRIGIGGLDDLGVEDIFLLYLVYGEEVSI